MLYPNELDDAFDNVHAAGDEAAHHLSSDFQAHARTKGLPDDLVSDLHVTFDHETGDFHPGAKSEANHERLLDYEYGTETHPPTAVIRTFHTSHAQRAQDHFDNALMRALA